MRAQHYESADEPSEEEESTMYELARDLEEDLLDYEETLSRTDMEIDMVYYLTADFRVVDEDGEITQIDFRPKNSIFEKPERPVKHLIPLYVRGHINGKPVTLMMVDGGDVVNLMPYSIFKKLKT